MSRPYICLCGRKLLTGPLISSGSEQYLSASDYSDEEHCLWGRPLDIPGFDDNVSASNTVNSLLRFVLGEVALHLARSSDQVDKPYLMLRLDKLCADVALMEYGPALQASVNGIYLVDKLHIGEFCFNSSWYILFDKWSTT